MVEKPFAQFRSDKYKYESPPASIVSVSTWSRGWGRVTHVSTMNVAILEDTRLRKSS